MNLIVQKWHEVPLVQRRVAGSNAGFRKVRIRPAGISFKFSMFLLSKTNQAIFFVQ